MTTQPTYHQLPGRPAMNREPVLVVLNGLAATVGLILVACNLTHVTSFDGAQTTAIVAAVAGVCNLLALAIRAAVTPVAVAAQHVAQALATPVPSAPSGDTHVVIAGAANADGILLHAPAGIGTVTAADTNTGTPV